MLLTATIEKPGATNIGRQVLRGSLLGLVLVPTLLVWAALGSAFFGYRVVDAWGTSMEPVFRNGDALWVKRLDVADVKVGDILTLRLPYGEQIAHRVMGIEPLSGGSYLVLTKGDANLFTEEWRVGADETVAVMVARVPFGGYVFAFLASVPGTALVTGALVALVVIWMRQRHIAHGDK